MAQVKETTVKSTASKPAPKPVPKPAPAPAKPAPAPAKPSTPPPAPTKVVTASNSAAMAEKKMNVEANKIVSTPAPKPVTPPPPPPAPKPVVAPPVASKSVSDAKEAAMNKDVEKPKVVNVPDPVKVVPTPAPAPTPVQTPVASKSVSDAKEAAMNKDVDRPKVVKAPDPVQVIVPPAVTTPVAPSSVNDAKEVALTKELDKTTQAPTLFDTMIDTIIKKTDEINTVLTTVIANKPDVAIVTNNKEADDAKKLKDSDTVGSINTITGGMPTVNNVITTTPVGYTVKPAAAPLKQTGQVEGTSGQVTASDSSKLLADQQKIEYDRFGKTIADLRKEAQAIGANGIDYIISQNLGTMTKAQLIENTKNYITSSFNQVALGNYASEDVTLLGTSIQVLAGVLGVDLLADLRDVSADLINFKPTGDHALQTGVDAMGLIPLIGVGKYADEIATLIKRADDYSKAIDTPITILKKTDEVSVVDKDIQVGSDMLQTMSRQSVDDKLTRYLLNADHPVGGSKAKWFKEALGYTQSNMDDLAKQITFDPTKAVLTEVTEYGTKFNQSISITGANGKVIDVTFAWMKSATDDVVRLVTSIPTKK